MNDQILPSRLANGAPDSLQIHSSVIQGEFVLNRYLFEISLCHA